MISSLSPNELPSISDLQKLCQSLAMLDAIIEPNWEWHYYSFDAAWDEGERMASMRNGSGDRYSILFCSEGCVIGGCVHDFLRNNASFANEMRQNLASLLPVPLNAYLTEPAFQVDEMSFCLWRTTLVSGKIM